MKGLVVKNTGSWYTVRTDDGQLLDCKVKGNFRLKGIRTTNPVAVGDRVEVNEEGWIVNIEDRRNYIIRKSINLSKQSHIIAANVDQAFLIVTVANPQTSTTFIDRFLASAEAYRVPVVLIFNKKDLLDEDALRYQQAVPVFIDCDDSFCMDPVKLRSFCEEECLFDGTVLTHRGRAVKALIVVHVFGNMADMEAIMDFC